VSLRIVSAALAGVATDPIAGAPPARATIRPGSREELAEVLAACSTDGLSVLVWGHGHHQGIGGRVEPDIVLSTERLDRVVDHQPEDLTLTVEGGVPLGAIAAHLSGHRQFAVVPEAEPAATIGGVLAAGVSGYRRLRLGPTRDHVLEVTIVTGDGRVVRAGARVVKHVQGYDLMRLAVGSLGALGVIAEVCLKLWPAPPVTATVVVPDARAAVTTAYRPQAVLETPDTAAVYLAGTAEEVEAQAEALGGTVRQGHLWPRSPEAEDGEGVWSIRVPSPLVADIVADLPDECDFVAQHGVGVVVATLDREHAVGLRSRAEAVGGSVVLLDGPLGWYDDPGPWGAPPPALDLQRRIVARFDPDGVLNPGRSPI
jgi:glycolate oxidase FAD binding subunit